jgi:hypothetical protein
MTNTNYEANLDTAISYLKSDQRDSAVKTANMALSQVPAEDKRPDNYVFFKLLSLVARFAVEDGKTARAEALVEEGLALKKMHADLMFLKSLIHNSRHQYGEMLTSLISYLIAADLPERELCGYDFVNPMAMKEVLEKYLPLAYKNTPNHEQILLLVENTLTKLKDISSGYSLEEAFNVMAAIDRGAA